VIIAGNEFHSQWNFCSCSSHLHDIVYLILTAPRQPFVDAPTRATRTLASVFTSAEKVASPYGAKESVQSGRWRCDFAWKTARVMKDSTAR
jgi:hypothetical protein